MSDSKELEPTEPEADHDASLTLRIPPPESTGANEEEPAVAWSHKRGGGLLILIAGSIFLILNFFDVYPATLSAEEASWRENGYGIVLVSAGLVLSFFAGRNKIAVGASMLVGVVMIVVAVLVGYPLTLRMIDFGAGVAAIVGGIMSLPGASDD